LSPRYRIFEAEPHSWRANGADNVGYGCHREGQVEIGAIHDDHLAPLLCRCFELGG
jgi:hypothetical protein